MDGDNCICVAIYLLNPYQNDINIFIKLFVAVLATK